MIKEFKKTELKELLQTKNLLEFNRDLSEKHVEKMIKSIVDCGILRYPVIGDVSAFDKRNYVIIDGQHLCKAIVNLPNGSAVNKINAITKVYTDKKEVIEDISKLNNTQKSWNDENYLDAWYKYGRSNESYFSNYSYLYNLYNEVYDGLPCGFLVDLYSVSKSSFREGNLEFKNREFSDKLASLCYDLKKDFKKASFALTGLSIWAFGRINEKKDIDFFKLRSRLFRALSNREDKNIQGREEFKEFVKETYTRL